MTVPNCGFFWPFRASQLYEFLALQEWVQNKVVAESNRRRRSSPAACTISLLPRSKTEKKAASYHLLLLLHPYPPLVFSNILFGRRSGKKMAVNAQSGSSYDYRTTIISFLLLLALRLDRERRVLNEAEEDESEAGAARRNVKRPFAPCQSGSRAPSLTWHWPRTRFSPTRAQ